MKQQIADLQAQNKQKDLDNQKEMNDLKMTYAIRTAVSASAQDSDLVAGLVDRNKLILGDDGKITGLDEQVKALKESKPFLFKAEDNGGKKGFFRIKSKRCWRIWWRKPYEYERGNCSKTEHGFRRKGVNNGYYT